MLKGRRNRITEVLRALERQSASAGSCVLSFGRRSEYRVSVATTPRDRLRCWQLVYQVYRQKEYAAPDRAGLWYSLFDALPDTVTLMAERAGELVGTITVTPDSPLGLPLDHTFREHSTALRLSGRRVAEVCSLAQRAPSERVGVRVVSMLCELAALVAHRVLECSDLLITVNPRHEGFYTKLMLFERRGDAKDCARVSGAPAVCLHLDLTRVEGHVRRARGPGARPTIYKRFMPARQAQQVAGQIARRRRPLDEASLRKYFVEDRPLIPEAPARMRHYLEDCYPFYELAPETSDTREYLPV